MKKTIVILILLTLVLAGAFAEDKGAFDWKPAIASTTYGLVFMPVTISNANGDTQQVFLTGMDVRVFNGKNITKRGGFYTGVETGALIFPLPLDGQLSSMKSNTSTDVSLTTDQFLASVFLMAKYGYRLDLGFKLFGISLGAEAGIGARIASGFFTLYGSDGTDSGEIDMGYEASYMSMILDAAVEAAIRLGPNFRLVGKIGGIITPPYLSTDYADTTTPFPAPLTGFDFESDPFLLSVRLGFIMSY